MEFSDEAAIGNAVLLNDTVFRGRQIKVTPKRTNVPGFNRGKGKGKGVFARGKGKGYLAGAYYPVKGAVRGKGKALRGKGTYISPY